MSEKQSKSTKVVKPKTAKINENLNKVSGNTEKTLLLKKIYAVQRKHIAPMEALLKRFPSSKEMQRMIVSECALIETICSEIAEIVLGDSRVSQNETAPKK